MTIALPLRTQSEANVREHWRVKSQRVKSQRFAVMCALNGKTLPPLPAVVTLTRIGKRVLDDDNLASSFKAIRDEVAKQYGVDDGSKLYTWKYEQRTGKEYGIEISIVPF